MTRFVVDAGPIIHLHQIGQITLLTRLPSLYISTSVAAEVSIGSDGEILLKKLRSCHNVDISAVTAKHEQRIELLMNESALHKGEKDTIRLANTLKPAIVLTDDLNARGVCNKLRIEAHGSVGIIAHSYHRNLISLHTAETSLRRLATKSNLFITYTIIEEALNNLKKLR